MDDVSIDDEHVVHGRISRPIVNWFQIMWVNRLKRIYFFSIVLGFLFRLATSLQAYGMKHPDEIFQSLEMAHFLVYGQGNIPPEFQNTNDIIPSYAASRSWLFPYFFAMFMWIGEFFNLNYFTGTLVLIKIYMAIHATLLIPAIYKLTYQVSKDEKSATIAAFGIAFWFRIIEYTVRTFTNTFFLPLIFYGIYKLLNALEENNLSIIKSFEIGFLLGISTYVRLDMGIVVFAFFLVYFSKSHILGYLKVGIFGLLFWLWGAWIDYDQYDGAVYFSVPLNWFTFNIIEGNSKLFGVSGPFDYFGLLLLKDLLIPWLLIMVFWPIIHLIRRPQQSILHTEVGKSFVKILWVTTITWIIYSNLWPTINFNPFTIELLGSHKETRFIISGLVMFLIAAAIVTRLILGALPVIIDGRTHKTSDSYEVVDFRFRLYRGRIFKIILVIFLVINIIGVISNEGTDHHEGINRGLMYIGQQDNVDVIMVTQDWFNTGYYTYSHANENVRFIFAPLHKEETSTFYQNQVKVQIESKRSGLYLVTPEYAFYFMNNLNDLLSSNNWQKVYEANDVSTWTFSG